MREDDFKKGVNEGLGDLADAAERDHEVQMARAQLYKLAKYSVKLHDMLKNVSEADGLEGWVQAKITKASDYLSAVYHHLDYEAASGEINDDEVDAPVAEGRLKKSSYKQGVKAAKSAGKKRIKHLRTESLHDRLAEKLESKKKTNERSLTKGEEGKKEKYVKGMKKAKGDFKKRYGKDAEAVMYATATKMAKK